MKSNLFLRVASALILAPIVLAAIIYGEPAYDVLVAVMGALLAWEWEKMLCDRKSYVSVSLTLMAALVVFLARDINPVLILGVIAFFALFLTLKRVKNCCFRLGLFILVFLCYL